MYRFKVRSNIPGKSAKVLRSGSVYIMAMGTSIIVACLALIGLQAVRVQRRCNEAMLQTVNAAGLAQCGIEFAQHAIQTNANWRTRFSHGVPVTRNTTGGSFSVTLTDPDDGSISNQPTDPVIISSTGSFGSSTQKISAYLEPQNQLFAACRSSLYAASAIRLRSCTVHANQWAYSEDWILAMHSSTVNVNCLAANNIVGSGFNQRSVIGGVWPMEKPELNPASANYIGTYYINNAVRIDADDLPTGETELTTNGGFTLNTANWTAFGCTLNRVTNQAAAGPASCFVSGRSSLASTPIQNITQHMVKNRAYRISFWVRTIEDQDVSPMIVSYGSGDILPTISTGTPVQAKSGIWTWVSRNVTVTWSGTLTRAEFQIGTDRSSNYHFDSVSIRDTEREMGTRYIENVRLGFSNNPFGDGSVSVNGIYVISLPGENLVIRNSRINGTLVIQDSYGVEFKDAVSWEPSGRNFPALISKEEIKDYTSGTSLDESVIGVNLNPSDTPYQGDSNTTATDRYPTVVSGAIVSSRDIELKGVASYRGPIMSDGGIWVDCPNLSIQFPSDMLLNPPPGFYGDPPKMLINSSSYQSIP